LAAVIKMASRSVKVKIAGGIGFARRCAGCHPHCPSVQVGGNVVITYDSSNTITLQSVTLANLHQNDFVFI
jgi:hypothetical protein